MWAERNGEGCMKRKMLLCRNISLGVMAATVIIRTASSLTGMPLPDAAVRMIGVLQMISLAVFAFSAIRYRRM